MRVVAPVPEAALHLRGSDRREDGDPVVRLLAVHGRVVPERADRPASGTRSSVTFSSCRQRTSGWCVPSQRRSLSSRARIELTFQVASFMSRLYPRTRRLGQLSQRRAPGLGRGGPDPARVPDKGPVDPGRPAVARHAPAGSNELFPSSPPRRKSGPEETRHAHPLPAGPRCRRPRGAGGALPLRAPAGRAPAWPTAARASWSAPRTARWWRSRSTPATRPSAPPRATPTCASSRAPAGPRRPAAARSASARSSRPRRPASCATSWPTGTRARAAPSAPARSTPSTGTTTSPASSAPDGAIVSWDSFRAEQVVDVLATHRPVCWDCRVAETFRREHPELVTDRPPPSAPARGGARRI